MTETQTALPRHAEVVIIGGGAIGVSAALLLTERGNRVVLCEKTCEDKSGNTEGHIA